MQHQDWNDVVIRKKPQKSTARALPGQVEAVKRFNAGTNHAQPTINVRKLDDETEAHTIKHVSLSLGQRIQQQRQAAGLTQKELAAKINEKPQVISEYEQGRAQPNQEIISKLERILGKLRK